MTVRSDSPFSTSKLALGTAQFGLDYGVTNHSGQTSQNDVSKILRLAQELGIGVLDTAAAYGEAERVLGSHETSKFRVVTKISLPPRAAELSESWVVEQVEESLLRLRRPSLSAVLIHAPENLRGPHGARLISGLIKARESGLTEKVGVSIYEPRDLGWIFELLDPEIVQAPLNVFDRRLVSSGWLKRLSGRGVEVHVRSVFLQGSLLAEIKALPEFLMPWANEFYSFRKWADHQGLSPIEAALGFPLSFNGVDKIVVGVTSAQQLEEAVFASTASVIEYPTFSLEDSHLINPVNWPK
jgi:aryl-alcohol dehydrogenase-like predicted oxidoreductase